MADIEDLYRALDDADKAGREDDVRDLTAMIREAEGSDQSRGLGRRTGASPQKIERFVKPVQDLRARKPMTPEQQRETAKGMGQVAARTVAGAAMTPIAGLAGLAGAVLPGPEGQGAKWADKVMDKTVGQIPMNEQARTLSEGIAAPIQALKEGMGRGGEIAAPALGMSPEAGRTMGEAWPDVAATLIPGAKAVQGGQRAGSLATTATNRGLTQTQMALKRMQQNGYVVPPQSINPTTMNKMAATLANPEELLDEVVRKNSAMDTLHAKQDVGLKPSQALNQRTLNNIKEKHGKAYQAIRQLDDVQLIPDQQLRDAVMGADRATQELKARFPDYYKDNKLERLRAETLNNNTPLTTGGLLDHIQNLRNDATALFKKADAGPAEKAQAHAMRNIANAMEDWLERKVTESYHVGGEATAPMRGPQAVLPGASAPKLQGPGPGTAVKTPGGVTPFTMEGGTGTPTAPGAQGPATRYGGTLSGVQGSKRQKLIDDWREARRVLAKVADIEASTNLEIGKVDPSKISKLGQSGKLTGGLEKIRQAHDATKDLESSHLRAGDATTGNAVVKAARAVTGAGVGGGVGLAAGGPVGAGVGAAAGIALPMATRKAMVSKLAQQYMTHPSPSLLQQIKKLDPKAAAALGAATLGKTNAPLPPPAEQPAPLQLEPEQ